jgi:hypothetical protein
MVLYLNRLREKVKPSLAVPCWWRVGQENSPQSLCVLQVPMSFDSSSGLTSVVFTKRDANIGDRGTRLPCTALSSILTQGPNAGVYSSSDVESYKRREEDKPQARPESYSRTVPPKER